MIAYFIGGSWDLTKRHMPECPPAYEVITIPRLSMKAPPTNADMDTMATVKTERELYSRARHDHEGEIAIYIFEEQ